MVLEDARHRDQRIPTHVVPSHLDLSSRYWYAQALADTLRRGRWVRVVPSRADWSNRPSIRTTGTTPPKPRMIQVRVEGLPRAGIHPAVLVLGRSQHSLALQAMTQAQHDAWWKWTGRRKDRIGRVIAPGALFRSHGRRVARGENSERHVQDAALVFLDRCTITLESSSRTAD